MMDRLDDRQTRFVEKPRIARLATIGRDGAPLVTPVWYALEDGDFLVLTDAGSQKHRNIERDPRVELCIDDERPPYHTVLVRGRAAIEPERGPEWRLALAVRYLGEDGGRRYVSENPPRAEVLLRITPERLRGW
jgi:PPOX class probable F420-dependent enzyme